MAETFDIRMARREDAASIHRLLEALAASIGKPGGIAGSVADIERFGFGETPRFEALIARREGQDIGLLLYFPEYSSWRGRPGLYVQDLFVAETARGQGVAQALLAAAAERAGQDGSAYLRLSADAGNERARNFYKREGFRQAAEDCIYVLDGDAFAGLAIAKGGGD